MRSAYLRNQLSPEGLRRTADEVVEALRGRAFDYLAFTGMSGALIAPLVGTKLDKPLLMVRKEGFSHSPYRVEGPTEKGTYVIVDDMIDTGKTIQRIEKEILFFNGSVCSGVVLYLKYLEAPLNFFRGRPPGQWIHLASLEERLTFLLGRHSDFWTNQSVSTIIGPGEDEPSVLEVFFPTPQERAMLPTLEHWADLRKVLCDHGCCGYPELIPHLSSLPYGES